MSGKTPLERPQDLCIRYEMYLNIVIRVKLHIFVPPTTVSTANVEI